MIYRFAKMSLRTTDRSTTSTTSKITWTIQTCVKTIRTLIYRFQELPVPNFVAMVSSLFCTNSLKIIFYLYLQIVWIYK